MNNIPTITRNLLVINVVVFLATYAFRGLGIDLNDLLGLHFMLAPDFHFYQLYLHVRTWRMEPHILQYVRLVDVRLHCGAHMGTA